MKYGVRGSGFVLPEDGGTSSEQHDAVVRDGAVVRDASSNASDARQRHHQHHRYAEKLHRISHILHYCSIVILGIFAFQVQTSGSLSRHDVVDQSINQSILVHGQVTIIFVVYVCLFACAEFF